MEEFGLAKEKDEVSKERLAAIRQELTIANKELANLTDKWRGEKANLDRIGDLTRELDELKNEIDRAQRAGDLEKAARLMYGKLRDVEAQLQEARAKVNQLDAMVKEVVTADDIAEVISAWTKIPVGKLLQADSERLLNLDQELAQRVIGQDLAVHAVADAIRRSRSGVSDPNRPTGVFLFLGPTGVGKTELAKALAQFMFDDEHAIVRIDMSEYGEKFATSRLVGAPPGYVGYEEGGQLTEAIRRRPYSVILLDEVEKAHPEVFDLLLQVFDDGRLTDSQGHTVDFKNSIIVMTSNLQRDLLNVTFKPEFLNRIDEILNFNSLSESDIAKIVDLQIAELGKRLADRKITLLLEESAKSWLLVHGYDPTFGARPLRRLIQSAIGNRLATMILEGRISDQSMVRISATGDGAESLEFEISEGLLYASSGSIKEIN
jgi:ATP-dependent Clp protease ATP-binding subunit ClpB